MDKPVSTLCARTQPLLVAAFTSAECVCVRETVRDKNQGNKQGESHRSMYVWSPTAAERSGGVWALWAWRDPQVWYNKSNYAKQPEVELPPDSCLSSHTYQVTVYIHGWDADINKDEGHVSKSLYKNEKISRPLSLGALKLKQSHSVTITKP